MYEVDRSFAERYIPIEYVVAVKEVFGEIDLDPASTEEANQIVGAKHFFNKEDDGLLQKWKGRVYLNPPYAHPEIERFLEKLVSEYKLGDVTEAIVLTNNSTDTNWFHLIAEVSSAFCVTRGRIKFISPKEVSRPLQGQIFFYLGGNTEKFASAFTKFGFILRPYKKEIGLLVRPTKATGPKTERSIYGNTPNGT